VSEPRRAISVRQPFAWAIVHAGKDVENRSETAIRAYRPAVGRRILIDASPHRLSKADMIETAAYLKARGVEMPDDLEFGGVIGSVMVVDIVAQHRSRWFHGPLRWCSPTHGRSDSDRRADRSDSSGSSHSPHRHHRRGVRGDCPQSAAGSAT
jgi:hypothetical protein